MGSPADGSGHRRENRRPADPEQRRPRSLGRLFALVVGVILVVLVIWLVIYFAARASADAGYGASDQGMVTSAAPMTWRF
ncbi:hypothetical protein [Blastococcus capsensis]|uniref:hypothetical protein n=1 Tax=Blastococcus capsensis TaxID=1564163 RepID=UPI0025424AFC|nr:hypothetical protein [Blastococcus capsensis]MDK3257590.1 hypothetical protein [Blastococcus capsensis]